MGAYAALVFVYIFVHAVAASPIISENLQDGLESRGSCLQDAGISLLQSKAAKVDKMQDTAAQVVPQSPVLADRDGGNASQLPKKQTIKCITHTGGNCLVSKCAEWRGGTTCSMGRCLCKEGFCSDVEGKCVPHEDRRVAANFTLRNARYPDLHLYISQNASEVLVAKETSQQMYFNLFEPPGQAEGPREYFLGSDVYANFMATITKKKECSGNIESGVSCQIAAGSVAAVPIDTISTTDIMSLGVGISAAPPYEGMPNDTQSIMIESYRFPRHFFAVSPISSTVKAVYGDGGASSYWIPSKQLPIPFKPYKGPLCKYDCGAYASGPPPTKNLALYTGVSLGSILCICCFVCCFSGGKKDGLEDDAASDYDGSGASDGPAEDNSATASATASVTGAAGK